MYIQKQIPILLLVSISLLGGCRSGKSTTQQLSSLQRTATSSMSEDSISKSNVTMDASLAGYLPNKNEIDEPIADELGQASSFRRNAEATGSGSGCQNGCCH